MTDMKIKKEETKNVGLHVGFVCVRVCDLTLFCRVSNNDLAPPLAGFLHRERCAQTLLMFPKALSFPESILLHDFMSHCTPARQSHMSIA